MLENTGEKTNLNTPTMHKLNINQEKQTTQKNTTKQNYPGSVASYDTRPHAPAHTGFINKLEMNTALNS